MEILRTAQYETGERCVSKGRLTGFMAPLMRLYRCCPTKVSLEREKVITDVVTDLNMEFGGLGVLIMASLAYGMSIPESDIDLAILTTSENQEASNAFLQELSRQLSGVKIHIQFDAENLGNIQKVLDFLTKKPGAAEKDIVASCGQNTTEIIDFFVMIKKGGLFFGYPVDWLTRRIQDVTRISPLLAHQIEEAEDKLKALIIYQEAETEDRYLDRLETSEPFQLLSDLERQELLNTIEIFWKELEREAGVLT